MIQVDIMENEKNSFKNLVKIIIRLLIYFYYQFLNAIIFFNLLVQMAR